MEISPDNEFEKEFDFALGDQSTLSTKSSSPAVFDEKKKCGQCRASIVPEDPHPQCVAHSVCFKMMKWDPRHCLYCNKIISDVELGDSLALEAYKKRIRNMKQCARRHGSHCNWISPKAINYIKNFDILSDVIYACPTKRSNSSRESDDLPNGHHLLEVLNDDSRDESNNSHAMAVPSASTTEPDEELVCRSRKSCQHCRYKLSTNDPHPCCTMHSSCFMKYTWDPRYCHYCVELKQKSESGNVIAWLIYQRRVFNMKKMAHRRQSKLWINSKANNFLPNHIRGSRELRERLKSEKRKKYNSVIGENDESPKPESVVNSSEDNNFPGFNSEDRVIPPVSNVISNWRRDRCADKSCRYRITQGDPHPCCTRHSSCFKDFVWKPFSCAICLDLKAKADKGHVKAIMVFTKRLRNMMKRAYGSGYKFQSEAPSSWLAVSPTSFRLENIDRPSEVDASTVKPVAVEPSATGCKYCDLVVANRDDPHGTCTLHSQCWTDYQYDPRNCPHCNTLRDKALVGNFTAFTVYKNRWHRMRKRAWSAGQDLKNFLHPEAPEFHYNRFCVEGTSTSAPNQPRVLAEETKPIPELPAIPVFRATRKCLKCNTKLFAEDPHITCTKHSLCFAGYMWNPIHCEPCNQLKRDALAGSDAHLFAYRKRYVSMQRKVYYSNRNTGVNKRWILPEARKDFILNYRGSIGALVGLPPCHEKESNASPATVSTVSVKVKEEPWFDDEHCVTGRAANLFSQKRAQHTVVNKLLAKAKAFSGNHVKKNSYFLPTIPSNPINEMDQKSNVKLSKKHARPKFKFIFDSSSLSNYCTSKDDLNDVKGITSVKILLVKVPKLKKVHISPRFCRDNGLSLSSGVWIKKTFNVFAMNEAADVSQILSTRTAPMDKTKTQLPTNILEVISSSPKTEGPSHNEASAAHANPPIVLSIKKKNSRIKFKFPIEKSSAKSIFAHQAQYIPSAPLYAKLNLDDWRLSKGGFRCPCCAQIMTGAQSFRYHYMVHSGEKPFVCPACPYATIQKNNLHTHVENIHGLNWETVGAKYCVENVVRRSKKKKKKSSLLNGSVSSVSSQNKNESSLQTNENNSRSLAPADQSVINSTQANASNDAELISVQDMQLDPDLMEQYRVPGTSYINFKCPICPRVLASRSFFLFHYAQHSGTTMQFFYCEQCSYKTLIRKTLDLHVASLHHGLPPGGQPTDGVERFRELDLERLRVEGDEDTYKCPMCRLTVHSLENFKTHYVAHSGECLFRCPFCDFFAHCFDTIDRHAREIHPGC